MNAASVLQSKPHFHPFLALALASALCLAMVLTRVVLTGWLWHLFLVWNLFLAWLPLIGSSTIAWMWRQEGRHRRVVPFFAIPWLLIFPNAPYIITDLVHLQHGHGLPLWFDLVLLSAFGWTGLLLGMISLRQMHDLVSDRWGATWGWRFVGISLLAGSFGIYLGRFLRWNSWDVLLNPRFLAGDILELIKQSPENPSWAAFTVLFAVFQLSIYLILRSLGQGHAKATSTATQ